MNAALTLATILSMVLAISGSGTGGSANQKKTDSDQTLETSKDKASGTIWGSLNGVNLNHNETLVRDAQFKPTGGFGCSPWVCGSNHNETLVRDRQYKPTGGTQCSPLTCGSNHNETVVHDGQFKPTIGPVCSPLVCGENYNETLVREATSKPGGVCSPIVCGSNHNETLASDAPRESKEWTLRLSGEQPFSATSLLSELLTYFIGNTCSPAVCGSNHSETLTRDEGPRGHNLNHNQTLVRDSQFKRSIGSGCSPWVCGANHNEMLVRDKTFWASGGTACPVWLCGANHNETLDRDVVASRPEEWSRWASSDQAFSAATLFFTLIAYRIGGSCAPMECGANHNETLVRDEQLKLHIGPVCSPLVCGLNHNETLVRDATASQWEGEWRLWLTSEQVFADVPLVSALLSYRSSFGCSPTVCGTNHNETLIRDSV